MSQGNPRSGEFYKNTTGELLQVLTIASHSVTGERLVICQILSGTFARYAIPYDVFVARADQRKYPNAPWNYTLVPMEGERSEEVSHEKPAADTSSETYSTTVSAANAPSEAHAATAAIDDDAVSKASASTQHNTVAYENRSRKDVPHTAAYAEANSSAENDSQSEDDLAGVNKNLLAFLDADDVQEKYEILNNMSMDEIDDQMIDTMAVSLDVVIPEGPVDMRLIQLKNILKTRGQYELKRFR